jgi:hypothetical protein
VSALTPADNSGAIAIVIGLFATPWAKSPILLMIFEPLFNPREIVPKIFGASSPILLKKRVAPCFNLPKKRDIILYDNIKFTVNLHLLLSRQIP